MPRQLTRLGLLALAAWLLAACATPQPTMGSLPSQGVLLLGEQHDNPHHQRLQHQAVEHLVARGQLAALALEMAPAGTSTQGLPADASDQAIQQALRWSQAGWPWSPYAPAIQQAVRAGVVVVGANLPRSAIGASMQNRAIDQSVSPAVWQQQRQAVDDGHCGLLPASQLDPMTRVQVARDQSMARVLAAYERPGQVTVLLTGSAHADKTRGVPLHLPPQTSAYSVLMAAESTPTAHFDAVWTAPAIPPKDYCAELKRQGMPSSAQPS